MTVAERPRGGLADARTPESTAQAVAAAAVQDAAPPAARDGVFANRDLLLLIPHDAGPLAMVLQVAGWLGHGCGICVWNVNTITLRQAVTPTRVLARMNPTYRMLLFGALPAGAMAGGLLGNAIGLRPALITAAIALTSPILWIFFSPVFRLTEMPSRPLEEAA
jgi:Transmembrane secretion effector